MQYKKSPSGDFLFLLGVKDQLVVITTKPKPLNCTVISKSSGFIGKAGFRQTFSR